MKNIYNITKGQLISVWVFGVISWFYSIDSYSDFSSFLSIFIPAFLVFYTIGWRTSHNTKVNKDNLDKTLKGLETFLPKKDMILKFVKPIIVIILFIIIILFFVNSNEERVKKEKLAEEYNQAILNLDNLKTQFTTCMQPTIDKKYQDEFRSCNLLKDKIKAEYNFCVSVDYRESKSVCLYENDYESIDCSQETIERKAKLASINDIPTQCSLSFSTLMDANDTIKEYSNLNKEK